ncbi:hypothetical protein BAUCODRAFT_115363 [Baudoinia panamericana UAMH 10762]|uniref:GST N-terminal domain-containing protein n=1 Tax=Baudoinia panamericana (strain UAMH 10762) TaxID=717646 RepID=M2M709_BAUPA|nr:uncharacterized protein BAUCODRAFT_115363 [Baudoinia panamericana UAMH 10762]EMC92066.1 hypothetical protein BAUCODRAFT_115363 [Baudoinia panamericana UAMH 10762]
MADNEDVKPKATLYWLDRSRSQRILWLLRECQGLDFDVKIFKRQSNQLAPPELKEIHPLGKSPIVSIEAPASPKPLILAESAMIVEYLCEHFATHLIPKRYRDGKEGQAGGETEQWLRYRYFMHYAEGSLMIVMILAVVMDMIGNNPSTPFFIRPITRMIVGGVNSAFLGPQMALHFKFLEDQIATAPEDGPFFCGKSLTGVDILLSFPLIAARGRIEAKQYPKLNAYIDMIEGLESYKASVKQIEEISGEPYQSRL